MNVIDCVWRRVDTIARRRTLAIMIVALLSFGGGWLWALLRGLPIPYLFDEYSYLLAADTFAHGRITNPPHPMGEYFETFFVLQHPTYMSIYPPAQGAFLALGKIIFGHPAYGIWLSSALMCAAICWMLYAWVSPRWSLVGGVVSALQFGIFTYWNQGYWGGAVAGMGGALVFGALPRIFKTQRVRDALWLGLGCAALVNSQPLEGFLVCIPVGCLVLPWKIGCKQLSLAKFIKKIILPLSIILLVTMVGIGVYNKNITGDARVFPQLLYDHTSRNVPLFIWQPLMPSLQQHNHQVLYLQEKNYFERYYIYKRTWKGFVKSIQLDSRRLFLFFFGYPLAIPSLAILLLFFRRRQVVVRFVLALVVLLCTCAAMSFRAKPHYLATLVCLAALLVTIGLRGLSWLKLRKARVGLVLVILLIALQLGLDILLTPVQPAKSFARTIQNSPLDLPVSFSREELKNILIKKGGKYLVMVQYPPWHNNFWEWVYNDADIDHAPIVWARDMGATHNARLLEYFKDRQLLFIEIDRDIAVGRVAYYYDRQ